MADRVILVHTLEQALTALETASELQLPITLQSAPGAIAYAGSLYLLHLFAQAQAAYPHVRATCILDGGDAGADIIAAMQMGHRAVRSCTAPPLQTKLADIAAQLGVTFLTEQAEALDLLDARDVKTACRQFLTSGA